MILRAGIVAVHFAVLFGLAGHMGLAGFGRLMHLWAVALVVSTCLAAGGPLLMLRPVMRGWPGPFLRLGLWQPMVIAGSGLAVLSLVWPSLPWLPLVLVGFAVNLAGVVAAQLRGWGSVHLSMLLRDAAPILVLGAAAVLTGSPEFALAATAALLIALSGLVLVVAVCQVGPSWKWSASGAKGQGQLWMSSILGMGAAQVDLVIAGALLPPEVFGIYALLRRMANLVALPVSVAGWLHAGPVADALAKGDPAELQRASAAGSRAAWYPSLALCVIAVTAGVAFHFLSPQPVGQGWGWVAVCLLAGALLQGFWALNYPVAQLGDHPRLAVEARGLSLVSYVLIVVLSGASFGPFGHAASYTAASALGGVWLWHRLWMTFGVDTSALALRSGRTGLWRMS